MHFVACAHHRISSFKTGCKHNFRRWRPDLAMDVVNRLQDIELQLKSGRINDQLCTAQSLLGICLRAPALADAKLR
jgi:hypothetical protein